MVILCIALEHQRLINSDTKFCKEAYTIIVVDVWLNSKFVMCTLVWVSEENIMYTLETRVHQIHIYLSSDIKSDEKSIDPLILFY